MRYNQDEPMKQTIPWPIKFSIKLVLGAARVDYRLLKRAHIVEHGRMEDADFSTEIFTRHVLEPGREFAVAPGGLLLELGPGDSVATAIHARAAGFSAAEMVDVGSFADLRPAALRQLFSALGAECPQIADDATPAQVIEILAAAGIRYRTGGLDSLQAIATGSIRYSFSNTVLQHVYRADLPALIAHLGRVHSSHSFASHSVNYSDHFSGGFWHHKFPDWFMESGLVKRAHLYTNRVMPLRYLELFEGAGFTIRKVSVDFDHDARQHAEYASASAFGASVAGRNLYRTTFIVQKN
jgi:hypothetical protein